MAASPKPHARFTVETGCLCFGALHNIWEGSLADVQAFPITRPELSGTVAVHPLEYNVAALNGTWAAYHLVDVRSQEVRAWFVCHSDVDPEREVDKILRVSGSPYEEDSGSSMNDDKTNREGVLVINRYDWGYYKKSFFDEIGEGPPEGDSDFLANSNSAGLVDRAHAQDQVREWKDLRPSERRPTAAGIWMYSPHAEYMFGRFGFDAARTAARSFLFFSTNTVFTGTAFSGLDKCLRKEGTHEERFERRLREGYDFSGVEELRRMSTPLGGPFAFSSRPTAPPESEHKGPYDPSRYVFRPEDLDALRLYRKGTVSHPGDNVPAYARIAEFANGWADQAHDLLNELALSYLDRFVVPLSSTGQSAAEILFPERAEDDDRCLDVHAYQHFTQPHAEPIPNFNSASVGVRIKDFLNSRSESNLSPLADDNSITGICRVLAYMTSEALQLGNNATRDSRRSRMVPYDIRVGVYNNRDLFHAFKYSRVFWKGRQDAMEG
ncbi:hypothetical protein Dda_8424 [Drechslerella dactyloides]|uniref:Uncharacterized protein n=1 Tax=Drechslerella dactyloides TaxID=74499 RepID=A0AAD6IT85_DREDA|nr:hypothetical protein Dda_8424 [Drechslerella dactyloides]